MYSNTSISKTVSVPWKAFLLDESFPYRDGILCKICICAPESVPLRQEFPLKSVPLIGGLLYTQLIYRFAVMYSMIKFAASYLARLLTGSLWPRLYASASGGQIFSKNRPVSSSQALARDDFVRIGSADLSNSLARSQDLAFLMTQERVLV